MIIAEALFIRRIGKAEVSIFGQEETGGEFCGYLGKHDMVFETSYHSGAYYDGRVGLFGEARDLGSWNAWIRCLVRQRREDVGARPILEEDIIRCLCASSCSSGYLVADDTLGRSIHISCSHLRFNISTRGDVVSHIYSDSRSVCSPISSHSIYNFANYLVKE